MKNFKSLFAAAALTIAINGAAHAAPPVPIPADTTMLGQRVFAFKANAVTSDSYFGGYGLNGPQSEAAQLSGSSIRTTVSVPAYLYVIGNLGGAYEVEGWGAGDKTFGDQQLNVYHNKSLQIEIDGSTVKRNTTSPALGIQLGSAASAIFNGSVLTGDVMPDINNTYTITSKGTYSAGPSANINNDIDLLSGFKHPALTGGYVKIGVSSKITVFPGTTAGIYSSSPTVTFNTL